MSKPGGLSVISWCGAFITNDATTGPLTALTFPPASALVKEDGRAGPQPRQVLCVPHSRCPRGAGPAGPAPSKGATAMTSQTPRPCDQGLDHRCQVPVSAGRVRHRTRRLAAALALLAGIVSTVVVAADTAALAADADSPVILAADSIQQVVDRFRLWLVGILAAVATLYLTVGALRYVAANGDPGEVEKAKSALRSAAFGYGLALIAPLIVTIVRGLVA